MGTSYLLNLFYSVLISGRISLEGHGAYGMSKHALVAYSDTLRQEMKKWDVKVSIIEPTGYSTGSGNEQFYVIGPDTQNF